MELTLTISPTILPRAAVRADDRLRLWPAAALGTLFVLLLARSWGTWPDPLVDFGRELYVPWRMSQGEVLYRDLAYFNGPLSPAVNALWFKLFGASLQTLVAANAVVLAGIVVLSYSLLRQIASRFAATAALAAFLALFAFAQFTRTRNYNYLCPYSHEMTHGMLLSLAALWASWLGDRRPWAAVLAGFFVGLAALTKPEATLAALAGSLVSLLALQRAAGVSWKSTLRMTIVYFASAAAPILAAVAWLSRSMPFNDASADVFASWRMALTSEIRSLPFYRRGLGTLNLGASFEEIAVSCCRWSVVFFAAYLLARSGSSRRWQRAAALSASLGTALGLHLWLDLFSWPLMERALPALLLALVTWQVLEFKQLDNRWHGGASLAASIVNDAQQQRRQALRIGWSAFALTMLAKIALSTRICQYGFVLAAPATMTLVAAAFDWFPAAACRRGIAGQAIAWFMAPLLAFYVLAYQQEQSLLLDRSVPLGHGRDAFAAAAHCAPVAQAVTEIERHIAPQETLAVLPEGVMLNYLTRRPTSVKYVSWMPPEVLFFGEGNMLDALKKLPPDWVLVAPRGLGEYGTGQFGLGFADSIARWIDDRYEPASLWGSEGTIGDEDARSRREWRLMRLKSAK